MKKLILAVFLLTLCANAQNFDFQKEGNPESNSILENYIAKKLPDLKGEIVSYYYDIDKNGDNEIIGIMKSQYFYSLAGYKFLILKLENDVYKSFKSDIYFDITNDFKIEDKKITYYKTIFYKNKKCIANIKKDKIKTKKSIFDFFKDKKVRDIEEITKFSENNFHNDFELENFNAQKQRSVNINYTNLNEKTKHYLDLK